jgi:hypothetical protein
MWRAAIVSIACACGAQLGDAATAPIDAPGKSIDAPNGTKNDGPLGDAPNACTTGRVVYLNFNGATLTQSTNADATSNPVKASSQYMGAANATIAATNRSQTTQTDIIAGVKATLAQFPQIQVVTTRPASGSYVMVIFGGTPGSINSPYIDAVAALDCSDSVKNDVAIIFDNATQPGTTNPASSRKVADYAIGAIGYGLGLAGVGDSANCLCQWGQGDNCLQQTLTNGCTLSAAVNVTAAARCAQATENQITTFNAFCQ